MQRFLQVVMGIATIVAIISVVIGIIGKLAETMVAGLTPSAYLRFTDTCLLFAITFTLFLLVRGKLEEK
jgi:hypothetical protein